MRNILVSLLVLTAPAFAAPPPPRQMLNIDPAQAAAQAGAEQQDPSEMRYVFSGRLVMGITSYLDAAFPPANVPGATVRNALNSWSACIEEQTPHNGTIISRGQCKIPPDPLEKTVKDLQDKLAQLQKERDDAKAALAKTNEPKVGASK